MNRKTLWSPGWLAVLCGCAPDDSNSYYVHMVGTIMIYAILRTAWTSVGYTGQVCWATPAVRCRPYTAGVLFLKLRAAVG
jgi:branched-chain amino acid transport system permease protein